MYPQVIILIVVIAASFIIAIIGDIIKKKNRKGEKDKNEISDAEKELVENKREHMDDYQRILTQLTSTGGI
ncbi:MAG: hypothetical protein ACTSWX_01410 [Promethearchaeota archaeon]